MASLNRDRSTWTDSTGHVTDLTLTWQDTENRRWQWDGTDPDTVNGPWMSSACGLREPRDAVLALWGPLTPVTPEEATR